MANSLSDSNVLDFAVITVANGNLAASILHLIGDTDVRLSDARTPLAHTHEVTDINYDFEVFQRRDERDQPNGYPSLNSTSRISGTEITYGTTAATACEGNDSRLNDARTPTGAASGDLSGNYPAPTVTGLQAAVLPTAISNGYLKRNGQNTGWEETADVSTDSRVDDLEERFRIVVAKLVNEFGFIPTSRLVVDMELGLSLID